MTEACCVEGCSRQVLNKSRQLCSPHYQRLRAYGDPTAGDPDRGLPYQWILDHVDTTSDDCLTWPFSVNEQGRGRIRHGGREHKASRFMCEQRHGPPPTRRHEAAHSCGNGHLGCVNPNHLRWATPEENQADRVEHGTSNRGTQNGHSKLDETSVRVIVEMKASGKKQRDIAKHLSVSEMAVSDVLTGRRWSWLTGFVPPPPGIGRHKSANDNEPKRSAA